MNLDLNLVRRLEETEMAAYADFGRAPASVGSRFEQIDGLTLLICGSNADVFMMNRVLGAGLDRDLTEDTIERVKQVFLDAGARDFGFQVAPADLTGDIASRLEAHDFKRADNWVRVIRDNRAPARAESDLRIEHVDKSHAADFARISCDVFELSPASRPLIEVGFDDPSFRHYMAFDGNEPVATGSLMVRDGIGWLGNGATLPSHRRRGAQSAIMARRIKDAIELGCRLVTTETGEETASYVNPSFHNMQRLGFELAYARPNFLYRPGT